MMDATFWILLVLVGTMAAALGFAIGRFFVQSPSKALEDDVQRKQVEIVRYEERQKALERELRERDENQKGLHEQLRAEFENTANRILSATANQLSTTSHTALASVLDPLKERITDFQKKVEDSYGEEAKQRFSLEKQIDKIVQANQAIGGQAESLAKALRADSQVRGRWGEIKLERILEAAGLERGREYFLQGEGFDFRTDEGTLQRPDVVVALPGGRHLIIDSKVSLIDYEAAVSAEGDEALAQAVLRLKASIRGHIDGLASRDYQASKSVNSHEFVFMFMPMEGALALVLQNDYTVFEYGWKKKVVIVSPANLLTTMKTVESIWQVDYQNANAQRIAEQAGALYDKLVGVIDDLNVVSDRIQGAAAAHNDAMKKLSTGRGNVLGRAERLRMLGVKTRKTLPSVTVDSQTVETEVDPDDYDEVIPPTNPEQISSASS